MKAEEYRPQNVGIKLNKTQIKTCFILTENIFIFIQHWN